MRRFVLGLTLSTASVLAIAYGCSPDLGDAPFLCNPGSPRCPTGYTCNAANVCVKDGVCPAGVPGCTGNANCGDGKCEGGETCTSCEKDCGKCPNTNCGDGKCEGGETCTSCEQDCGKCPAGCGDGKCENGENCQTCEQDCGKCPTSCGNNTCDNGETNATCPQDCPSTSCTAGTTKCLDTSTLEYCDQGTTKTDKCDVICATQFDYAVGCRLNPDTNKDICICANYANFGELCDNDVKCATGLFCGSFGATSSQGFCSKYCTNPGGLCTGGPSGTEARCNLNVGGQDACGFDCQSLFAVCPTGLTCDVLAGICKP
ncbi:MAG: hypothetical protein KC503_08665 [Myxococcales bacterium]|nr:hypothetical protein [Myxococcales bacterium]